MFYGDTVEDTRQLFFSAWDKYRNGLPRSPLEQSIVDVIALHPEYHGILEASKQGTSQQFYPELGQTNPFLHMGLHIAIREQIATNRPHGIHAIYQQLLTKYHPLEVEHKMMDQLAECLWLAQKNNLPPDEQDYFQALNAL